MNELFRWRTVNLDHNKQKINKRFGCPDVKCPQPLQKHIAELQLSAWLINRLLCSTPQVCNHFLFMENMNNTIITNITFTSLLSEVVKQHQGFLSTSCSKDKCFHATGLHKAQTWNLKEAIWTFKNHRHGTKAHSNRDVKHNFRYASNTCMRLHS